MNTRLNILPDTALLRVRSDLAARLEQTGSDIHADQFGGYFDPLVREMFQNGITEAGAHEGTIWVRDKEGQFLVPTYNTGPQAGDFVGKFKQPLNSGIICMVFASEQPFIENDVTRSPSQSKLLDSLLGVETIALIAVPFYFLQTCRGVISCVQLRGAGRKLPDAPGFRQQNLSALQKNSGLMTRLVEHQFLSSVIGWERH